MRPQHLVSRSRGPDRGAEPRRNALIPLSCRGGRDWSKANGQPSIRLHASSGRIDRLELVLRILVIALLVLAVLASAAPAARLISMHDAGPAPRAWISNAVAGGTIHPGGGGATASALCEVVLRKRSRGGPRKDAAAGFVPKCGTPVDAAAHPFFMKVPTPIDAIDPRGTVEEEV